MPIATIRVSYAIHSPSGRRTWEALLISVSSLLAGKAAAVAMLFIYFAAYLFVSTTHGQMLNSSKL